MLLSYRRARQLPLGFVIKHMRPTRLGRVMVGLPGVPHCEVRMAGGNSEILRGEMPFRFPVMMSGFFILICGIVMMPDGWM